MKKILNQLVQLQELEFTLEEQEKIADSRSLEGLQESIRALLEDLPADVASLYRRLRQRRPVVVAAETQGRCSACEMRLPTSQTPLVRSAKDLQQCQVCGRILYHLEEAPRQLPRESDPRPRVGAARFSSPDLMLPTLQADSSEQAVSELIQHMADREFVDSPEQLLAAALQREAIVSTAVGHGLAFPHVRGVEGGGITFSLGLKREGLAFDPSSNELTQIVFFIVIPTAASSFYLRLLSGLIAAFREEPSRHKLLACKNEREMWKVLMSATREMIQ